MLEQIENARRKIASGSNANISVEQITANKNLREEMKEPEFVEMIEPELQKLRQLIAQVRQ